MDYNQSEFFSNYTNYGEVIVNISNVTTEKATIYHGYDCLPVWVHKSIIVLYILIFITALLTNVAICYVIVCKKSMHTTTNYYLFNLSMSDLILLVFGITRQFALLISPAKFFSSGYMCFINAWVIDTSANVSIMTITTFTVERYLAICHPFLAHVMTRTSRVIKLMIVIWIIAGLSNVCIAWQYVIVKKKETTFCKLNKKVISHTLEVTMTTVFFIVPLVVMIILHMFIALNLSKITGSTISVKRKNELNSDLQLARTTKKTSRILVVIAISFFVCWAPHRIERLLTNYLNSMNFKEITADFVTLHCVLYNVGSILVLLSTIMNPLIFSIMSRKFRNAFMDISHETYQKVRSTKFSSTVEPPALHTHGIQQPPALHGTACRPSLSIVSQSERSASCSSQSECFGKVIKYAVPEAMQCRGFDCTV